MAPNAQDRISGCGCHTNCLCTDAVSEAFEGTVLQSAAPLIAAAMGARACDSLWWSALRLLAVKRSAMRTVRKPERAPECVTYVKYATKPERKPETQESTLRRHRDVCGVRGGVGVGTSVFGANGGECSCGALVLKELAWGEGYSSRLALLAAMR